MYVTSRFGLYVSGTVVVCSMVFLSFVGCFLIVASSTDNRLHSPPQCHIFLNSSFRVTSINASQIVQRCVSLLQVSITHYSFLTVAYGFHIFPLPLHLAKSPDYILSRIDHSHLRNNLMYHKKTNAELEYIAKDAHKAAEAMKSHNTTAEAPEIIM